ncbi:unnamed protein product [Kuraishia capsulata CBS 1993]|uniref:CBS domain-containing protein n=1 Tax=Kuraishia capsulata CBS 1993 TaxID=1382522 RepID=W6MP79_9ASCO|nr:uncharacterized protein KUCA_T00004467001 [Kuraishia capsulata CBS 1993]CDK28484.1 unnamed protein product [Kuraishia capsulata CBS 1993]
MGRLNPLELKNDPRWADIPVVGACVVRSIHNSTSMPHSSSSNNTKHRIRKKYADFQEIDWNYEYGLIRTSDAAVPVAGQGSRGYMKILDSRWVILSVSSFLMGMLAVAIDYLSTWFHDLRVGVCYGSFIKLESQCDVKGSGWSSWSHVIFYFMRPENMIHKFNDWIVYVITAVLLAFFAVVLTRNMPYAMNSGIADIKFILSGFVVNGFLSPRVWISKIVGLVMVVAAGVWVGKEGPLVHISCGVTDYIMSFSPKFYNNEALKREILSASTAAGIAVAFNAPIGGVLFTLEQISSFFPIDKLMWNSFVCATISVTVLQSLHPFQEVMSQQAFFVSDDETWLLFEALPFIILGLIGGFAGVMFNKLNIKLAKLKQTYIAGRKNRQLIEVLLLALVTAVVSYPILIATMPLPQMLAVLFKDCNTEAAATTVVCKIETRISEDGVFPVGLFGMLLLTAIQGFVLSSYSYGTTIPGGVLMPSLAIGALIGRLVGSVIHYMQVAYPDLSIFVNCNGKGQCISPGSYAVVGAGAFVAGVTKMTVAVVVILFELTGALAYVLPIMIGVLISRFVNDMFLDMSCYELWLAFQKRPYLRSSLEELGKPSMSMVECKSILKPIHELDLLYLDQDLTFRDLVNLTESREPSTTVFPVVEGKSRPILVGYLTAYELERELSKIKEIQGLSLDTSVALEETTDGYSINSIVNTDPICMSPDLPVLTLYEMLSKLQLPMVFFCYPGQGKLLKGTLTKGDLIEILDGDDLERI